MKPIVWLAGHLQHGADGHLMHSAAGHLSSGCASSDGTCPSLCVDCPTTLTMTIAGIGGPGPACCIAALNGTFTFTKSSESCDFNTGILGQPKGCSFGYTLDCDTTDCNGVPGPGRWVLASYGNIIFVVAQAFPASACPPSGAYAICSNPCGGGTGATLVLSS